MSDDQPHTVLLVSSQHEMGGAQFSLLDVGRSLRGTHYRPLILLPVAGELSDRCKRLNLDVVVIPFVPPLPAHRNLNPLNLIMNIRAMLRIARLVRERGIRLIHCNDGGCLPFVVHARWRSHVPVLFHVRWHESGIRRVVIHLLAASIVDKVVANSEAIRQYIRTRLPRLNPDIAVIHNAVDQELFTTHNDRSILKRELGIDDRTPLIGLVGRFVPWKRHLTLLHALCELRRRNIHPTVCLVGEAMLAEVTPDAHSYKRAVAEFIAREGLSDRVHMIGFRDDIHTVMRSFDLLVCPSEDEPFGRVVIEAMASGVPVIAARSGGIPEIIRHNENGLFFELDHVQELADLIAHLMENPALRTRLVRAGLRTVEERFSIRRLGREITAVYDELLDQQTHVHEPNATTT